MIKGLESILLYSADHSKTAEFYRKLGLSDKEIVTTPSSTEITFGGTTVFYFDQTKAAFPLSGNPSKGVGVFLQFEVENVDTQYQRVLQENLKPSSEPKDHPWKRREFAIRDPDGYVLVFFQPLN